MGELTKYIRKGLLVLGLLFFGLARHSRVSSALERR